MVVTVLVALFAAAGRGQTPSPRTILSAVGPRPIQRGISPNLSYAPGTPEARRRQSLRAAPRPVDRVGVSGPRYRAGRVIVKFRNTVSAASRSATVAAISPGATMAARPADQNFDVVHIDPGADAEAVARQFLARDDVEYAQAAYRVYPHFVPNDQFYPIQWNLPAMNLERAWDVQPAAGSEIVVAVLDTGVAFTPATAMFSGAAFSVDDSGNVGPPGFGTPYPALGNITLQFVAATELGPASRFVAPRDFIWEDALPLDLNGHGTHVSGTIGQLTNNRANGLGDTQNGGGTAGVAFNVRLMPVKVLSGEWDDIFGSPNVGTDDVVARGIRYAADNGAQVINMSIGRTGPGTCGANPNQPGCSPVVEDAIKYAVSQGAFVVISGGNSFADGNPTEVIAEIAGRVPGAVSVSAVNQSKGHPFYSTVGTYIELAAPGGEFEGFGAAGGILQQTFELDLVNTFELEPSQFGPPRFDILAYYFFIGTSQSAPHVSGLAAMLIQQGVTSPAAIEAALKRFATPCSETQNLCSVAVAPNVNATFGAGLVDARTTLRGLGLAK